MFLYSRDERGKKGTDVFWKSPFPREQDTCTHIYGTCSRAEATFHLWTFQVRPWAGLNFMEHSEGFIKSHKYTCVQDLSLLPPPILTYFPSPTRKLMHTLFMVSVSSIMAAQPGPPNRLFSTSLATLALHVPRSTLGSQLSPYLSRFYLIHSLWIFFHPNTFMCDTEYCFPPYSSFSSPTSLSATPIPAHHTHTHTMARGP